MNEEDEMYIFSPYLIENTPSRRHNISKVLEDKLRRSTGLLLFEMATACNLTVFTLSSSLLLFQVFYMFQSFQEHDRKFVGLACLMLASKAEEQPTRLTKIIETYILRLKQARPWKEVKDADIQELRSKVVIAERAVLHTLGFDLKIPQPFKPLVDKVRMVREYVDKSYHATLLQFSIDLLNDSLRTTLCLQYSVKWLSHCAVYVALLLLGSTPVGTKHRPAPERWMDLFKEDDVFVAGEFICLTDKMIEQYEESQIQPVTGAMEDTTNLSYDPWRVGNDA